MTAARRDVAVIGQGLIGLSTAVALARRGRSVVALDALGSAHPLTSSTGASRSIRAAYANPLYVRLALEALASWRALEVETGRSILHLTGQVDLAPAAMLDELEAGMAGEGIAARRLDDDGLAAVFPELRLGPGERALYHESGGTVLAAEGMAALADVASDLDVELAAPERVNRIDLAGDGAALHTDARTVEADAVVVAAGPWAGELLSPLGVDLPLSPGVAQVTYVDVPHLVGRPGIADWSIEDSGRGVYGHRQAATTTASASMVRASVCRATPSPARSIRFTRSGAASSIKVGGHVGEHRHPPPASTVPPLSRYRACSSGPTVAGSPSAVQAMPSADSSTVHHQHDQPGRWCPGSTKPVSTSSARQTPMATSTGFA